MQNRRVGVTRVRPWALRLPHWSTQPRAEEREAPDTPASPRLSLPYPLPDDRGELERLPPDTPASPRLPYRPGLDGLRALAVAGVLLYHAGVPWMPGGFLGVDVFFVLSGYLITSLLLGERARRGQVDFGAFWARRARRLLPAVWLVIFASLIAASTVARDDLARTRADALASLLYVTNWHLIAASHSYFNSFGRPSLLQHLWSLAVEEQFYLVWPILLMGGLALLANAGCSRSPCC